MKAWMIVDMRGKPIVGLKKTEIDDVLPIFSWRRGALKELLREEGEEVVRVEITKIEKGAK